MMPKINGLDVCAKIKEIKNIKANSKYELFEPFFVIEDSRNKRLSSTGLGLTIVKRILDEFFEFKIEFPIKKRL